MLLLCCWPLDLVKRIEMHTHTTIENKHNYNLIFHFVLIKCQNFDELRKMCYRDNDKKIKSRKLRQNLSNCSNERATRKKYFDEMSSAAKQKKNMQKFLCIFHYDKNAMNVIALNGENNRKQRSLRELKQIKANCLAFFYWNLIVWCSPSSSSHRVGLMLISGKKKNWWRRRQQQK